MSCSDEFAMLVSELVDGELSPADEERTRAHILTCRRCRALLQDFERQRDVFIRALEAGARAVAVRPGARVGEKPNGRKTRKTVPRLPLPILRQPRVAWHSRPRFSYLFLAATLALVVLSLAMVTWPVPVLQAVVYGTDKGEEYTVQRIGAPADLSWAEAVAVRPRNRFDVGEVARFRFGVDHPSTVTIVWNDTLEGSLTTQQGRWEMREWNREARESGRFILALVQSDMALRYADLPPGRYALCLQVNAEGIVPSGRIDIHGVHDGVVSEEPLYSLDNQPGLQIPGSTSSTLHLPYRILAAHSSRQEGEYLDFAVVALRASETVEQATPRAQVDWTCRPFHALLHFRRFDYREPR